MLPASSFLNFDTEEVVGEGQKPTLALFWLIAECTDGWVVFYDENEQEFGLGQRWTDRHLETINVRGDLVGVFCAR